MIDDLATVAPRATNTELRSILGCFLFSEDDVFKTIAVLSGGERNRYALARMLMMPSNFLLLDEPTNHLDMRAKEVLLTALQDYSGTLVFVSHDRYFIDKLSTRIFEVEDGKVHVFPGNYEDYLWRKTGGPGTPLSVQPETPVPQSSNGDLVGESLALPGRPLGPAPSPRTASPASQRTGPHASHGTAPPASQRTGPHASPRTASPASQRTGPHASPSTAPPGPPRTAPAAPEKPGRLNPIKLRRMKERQREIEEEVTRLELEISDYEAGLAHFVSIEETRRLSTLLEARRADLVALMSEWEEVAQSLEANR
jgi:ATP-binding cassette subfamily F protein 3